MVRKAYHTRPQHQPNGVRLAIDGASSLNRLRYFRSAPSISTSASQKSLLLERGELFQRGF